MTADKLHQAIQLINSGNKQEALPLLREFVQANPDNEKAWLWLSLCMDQVEQKKFCLRQAIRINPTNNNANLALLKLENLRSSSPKPVKTQGLQPPVASHMQKSPKRNGVQRPKAAESRPSLLQLGGLTFLLLILIGIVMFGGSWVYKGLTSPKQLAPAMEPSQSANISNPKNLVLYSITPTPSVFSPAPLRPSFTPYPTNTSFVISTWTPTKILTTLTYTAAPYQSPAQTSTNNAKSIRQTEQAGGGGSDSSPAEPPPATSLPYESPYDIPSGNVVPTKTQKSNYMLSCGVSPRIIQVGTITTLTVSAQMYIDGSATTTVALVAEWQDSQGRNFHCTSSGNSCQGQSGYFSGNDRSTIKIGASAADGTRLTCQTTFGTN